MIYLKSLLAGAVALIVAALITCVFLFARPVLKLLTDRHEGGDVGVYVVHLHALPVAGVSLLVFAIGFYWQYRRAR
jgi:Na+-driven multidrug efflux pump